MLKYYPKQQNWNDKFHNLRVTSNRKGVLVQTETGYYASAQPLATLAQNYLLARAETFDSAAIGLIARVSDDPRGPSTHVDLRIDAQDVTWSPNRNGYVAQLQVDVVRYLASGLVHRSTVLSRSLSYSAEQREQALKQGIDLPLNVLLDQADRADRIRFVVLDLPSNAVGSITIPVMPTRPSTPD